MMKYNNAEQVYYNRLEKYFFDIDIDYFIYLNNYLNLQGTIYKMNDFIKNNIINYNGLIRPNDKYLYIDKDNMFTFTYLSTEDIVYDLIALIIEYDINIEEHIDQRDWVYF